MTPKQEEASTFLLTSLKHPSPVYLCFRKQWSGLKLNKKQQASLMRYTISKQENSHKINYQLDNQMANASLVNQLQDGFN